MKKLTLTLLALVCALCCAFGLAACGGEDEPKEPTHEHALSTVREQPADCENGGHRAYYVCDGENGCGRWFEDEEGKTEITDKESVKMSALGHDWDDGTVIDPDCTHDGVTTYRCKRIGCTASNSIQADKLGHDVKSQWEQSVNTHYHGCSRCDYREDEVDHTYSDTDDAVCRICGNITYDTAFTFVGLNENNLPAKSGEAIVSYGVSAYTGNSLRVMIPLAYNEKPITRIEAKTFKDNTHILAVSIPRTVTVIGGYAFNGCTSLEEVELQGGITEVWECAFYHCTSLRNIIFSGKISKLGSQCFQDTGLRSIHLPDSLTELSNNVFAECANLTEVTIPSTVTKVGNTIFASCTSLENVKFLAQVDSLGDMMFYKCPLKSVTLSKTIKSIGAMCFAYSGLENVNFLPANLQEIQARAFTGCSKLGSIAIPSTVKTIGVQAFGSCAALKTVTGGGTLETIEGTAFRYCSILEKVEGTQNLVTIGDQAFFGCEKLSSFVFGNKLQTVGEKAFQQASIPSVNLGNSVKTLGNYAFANNPSLKSVTIGNGLQTIGYYAFYACSALEKVESNSDIGYGMFWSDTKLAAVMLGEHVANIGKNAFNGCTGLKSVTFERTDGWIAVFYDEDENATTVSLTVSDNDLAANAVLLKETYLEYYWGRE